MAKVEKEYQHYVPKFYLRFFSDNTRSIGTYIFKERKFIDQAALTSVGGKKFLYGEDGKIENWFAELESTWNKIIGKIIVNNKLLFTSIEEYVYLLMFVYLSDARSLEHGEAIAKFINDLAITMNNIQKKEKVSYDKIIAEEKIPNIYGISSMEKIVPMLLDLKLVLIINKTNSQYITSDCIITKYNQFLIEKEYKRGYGYGTQGIIILVPISPIHCLCLYDPDIYKIKEHNGIIVLRDINEVNRMNKLFIYNSDKLIFYNKKIDKQKLNTYLNQERIKKVDIEIYQSNDKEYLFKLPSKSINKNFYLNTFKTTENKIRVDLSKAAPQRLISTLIRAKEKETPEHIINKINGKKFYLKDKNTL